MEKFIGRNEELKTLEDQYNSKSANLVVVYGRRRIGKTTLLTEFLRRHEKGLYFLATEESEQQNRKAFKESIADFIGNEMLRLADADWQAIFDAFSKYMPEEKKIIVIDEFQYIGQSNAAFPSIMQKAWDTILKNSNVMLILCGSYVSMMKSQTLDYASPLYGRRTAQIKLKKIAFEQYKQFYPDTNEIDLVPFYAVTGGVPLYIEMFRQHGDIFEAIKENILTKQSFLYEEPYFLLQKEVTEIGSYFSLLKAIAFGNHKLSDIAAAMGVKATSVTKYLGVLIDLDLVEREVPVTEQTPEKSKSGLYKITDNYIAFWFKFVYPYRAFLEKGETEFVLGKIKTAFVQNYVSYIYEDVLREKMWRLNMGGTWPFYFDRVGRYWGAKIGEVDIVAIDSMGKNLIVGECKYSESEKGLGVLHALQKKGELLQKLTDTKQVEYVIFSKGGFTNGMQEEAVRNEHLLLNP